MSLKLYLIRYVIVLLLMLPMAFLLARAKEDASTKDKWAMAIILLYTALIYTAVTFITIDWDI